MLAGWGHLLVSGQWSEISWIDSYENAVGRRRFVFLSVNSYIIFAEISYTSWAASKCPLTDFSPTSCPAYLSVHYLMYCTVLRRQWLITPGLGSTGWPSQTWATWFLQDSTEHNQSIMCSFSCSILPYSFFNSVDFSRFVHLSGPFLLHSLSSSVFVPLPFPSSFLYILSSNFYHCLSFLFSNSSPALISISSFSKYTSHSFHVCFLPLCLPLVLLLTFIFIPPL